MNHDLRTPLTAMLNMISLMRDDPRLHCTPENLRLVQEAGEELKVLLQDIIDLAKLESGSLKLKLSSFAVRDLLNQTIAMFAREADRKCLQTVLAVDRGVPDRIMADKERLRQILTHLISNAVQYTEEGTITLRAVCSEPGSPGRPRLLFSVEDTGTGIPAELHERLFDRFLQPEGDGLLKSAAHSGLGLAVSKRLVQLMGGDLKVRSTVGKGSTFSFDLSWGEAEPVPAEEATRPLNGLAGLGPLRVLVVEDNFINLLSFSQMLERHGFQIRSAANGKQALDNVREQAFDIVLMDVKMPVMDGLEATRRIRSSTDRRVRETKIVALTAYAMPEDRKRILAAGVDDIVSKPIEVDELASVLTRVLGG